jgi:hypothetical protein
MAPVWKEITQDMKAIASTLSAQRARLGEAMIEGRTWTPSAWRGTFGAHPLLDPLARRLVWRIQAAEDGLAIPGEAGQWIDDRGRDVAVPEDARIAVAHPLAMPLGVQSRWQQRIVAAQIVQRFKQLFRETYVVTPAEEAAEYASARFTGQSVALSQIYAQARSRGWSGPLGQTSFDGAGEGRREFPAHGVRASAAQCRPRVRRRDRDRLFRAARRPGPRPAPCLGTDASPRRAGYPVLRSHSRRRSARLRCRRGRCIVVVGGRPIKRLDEEIVLAPETRVQFLTLVALAGG